MLTSTAVILSDSEDLLLLELQILHFVQDDKLIGILFVANHLTCRLLAGGVPYSTVGDAEASRSHLDEVDDLEVPLGSSNLWPSSRTVPSGATYRYRVCRVGPSSLHSSPTTVSGFPIAAMASRSLAAVIL